MANSLTIKGVVIDIGYLGDNVGDSSDYGLVIEQTDGQRITISGMDLEQCRSIKELAFDEAVITIQGAA